MSRPRATAHLSVLALVGALLCAPPLTSPAHARIDTYTPAGGVRLNDPTGGFEARNRIRTHIVRSINSVPPGGRIRVAAWNLNDRRITRWLAQAHRRGVTVQVIMQDDNAFAHDPDPGNPIAAPGDANPAFWDLRRVLRGHGNARRPSGQKSWARLCDASCRGGSGIAHTKMLLLDRVGRARHVVMYGSGNLTQAAAVSQWNDLQTVVGNWVLYRHANLRFNEMAHDRRLTNAYSSAGSRGVQLMFYPSYGARATADPMLAVLAPVHCRGTARGYGSPGRRTVIRVAQTAIGDDRGRRIALRLAQLARGGCNVRVLYGLMGPRVKQILRSAKIPIHQLARDFDGDWVYDRYLHQKVLTINGSYRNDTSTTLAINGTANWQGYTLRSDEVVGRITAPGAVRYYQRWIDSWFDRRGARVAGGVLARGFDTSLREGPEASSESALDEAAARRAGIDPYAKFEVN